MNKKLKVAKSEIIENQLIMTMEYEVSGLKPSGQMLVDSDHFSFIYLMENDADYTYIVFPESIWTVFKEAHSKNFPAYLFDGTRKVELVQFQEELGYLIDNIKGNSNYGEEMVKKVEEIF